VVQLVDQRLVVYGRAQNGPNVNDPGRLWVCRLLDNGALDTSFGGGDGCFMPSIVPESTRDSPTGVALQADGKIVLAGLTDQGGNGLPYEWFVARYDADGNLDPCFGQPGCVGGGVLIEPEPDSDLKNFLPYDVVVDGAGRILLAGATSGPTSQDFGVVRLLPGGAVDAAGFGNQGHQRVSFDQGGVEADSARAIAVRGDGAVFLVGTVDVDVGTFAGVAALDAFGNQMPGFGVAGKATFFFNDVAFDHLPQRILLQADGKLVVTGYTDVVGDAQTLLRDCGVARLRTDGTLDPVFGGDGRLTIDVGVGGESVERCDGADLDGRRIALFGMHQPESPGETDALVVVLEQDALFGDGFESL